MLVMAARARAVQDNSHVANQLISARAMAVPDRSHVVNKLISARLLSESSRYFDKQICYTAHKQLVQKAVRIRHSFTVLLIKKSAVLCSHVQKCIIIIILPKNPVFWKEREVFLLSKSLILQCFYLEVKQVRSAEENLSLGTDRKSSHIQETQFLIITWQNLELGLQLSTGT